jgi:uncharacterized membrane protein YdjX (TVP38/TMEM64 family)
MLIFALVFIAVYLLNLIPAFAPPTWMVFSVIGFHNLTSHVTWLALVGALAATSGRVTLAKLSRFVIRKRLLSQESKNNIDAIREGLQGREKLTFALFLLYALSPLPSNLLFIAYGLTSMRLSRLAVPFLLGRSASYALWGITSSAVGHAISAEYEDSLPYFGAYFVISQCVFLVLVYLFAKIDWRTLIAERRLRPLPRVPAPLVKTETPRSRVWPSQPATK